RGLDQACVLVRSWALSVSVQLQLLRAGIPFRLAREDRFVFRLPLVQALAGYLRLARDARLLHDPAHLLLLLSQPTPFVARERLQALAMHLAKSQAWPESHDPLLASLKPFQRRNLKRRWALLCELPKQAALPPARLLELVVERLDAEKVLKRAAARREKGEEDVRLLDVLIEQAEEASQAPQDFIDLLHRPVENRADGVLITTVHGAKGLEWPLVALWGTNEEDFPHYSRDNPLDEERLEEERRLFYVAITRARERLLMLHDGGEHRPSRFIDESAWQDGNRVAQALQDGVEGSLAVIEPALVQRYLGALNVTLALHQAHEASAIDSLAVYGKRARFTPGQRVRHEVFGDGEIMLVEGDPANPVIEVRFEHAGRRRLIARRAPLEVLQGDPMI
ncbi:MAG TPA: 3'-5' exonuclease, partial [Modicisalibacter sp.]|nr:3'-5' exonuclease [Modicisalibacter sp.]